MEGSERWSIPDEKIVQEDGDHYAIDAAATVASDWIHADEFSAS